MVAEEVGFWEGGGEGEVRAGDEVGHIEALASDCGVPSDVGLQYVDADGARDMMTMRRLIGLYPQLAIMHKDTQVHATSIMASALRLGAQRRA